MSAVKEPKFFLTDGPPPEGGAPGDAQTYREHVWKREDYEDLFGDAPAGALCGESTPFYLYDRAAQRRIRALIPDARLIVILRDPVERAHSNWTHLWSAGREPIGDFVRACAEEDRRVAAGWSAFWHYIRLGRYGEQLSHLFGLFPREQVLVFRYRRLIGDPAGVLACPPAPAAHLGGTAGRAARPGRRHPAAAHGDGRRLQRLAAAQDAFRRAGRESASRSVSGPQRPARVALPNTLSEALS